MAVLWNFDAIRVVDKGFVVIESSDDMVSFPSFRHAYDYCVQHGLDPQQRIFSPRTIRRHEVEDRKSP